MKKLLLCLVALFAAIGAQASSETITKGEGTSGTSTVKFSATGKPDITAKAVYTLTLNADNKLKVELTFADLNNSDVVGLANEPCYMFIDGIGETSLSYADGKYTGTTVGAATPGNFYSNCYFKRTCANTGANYGENGQLIFPFEFTAPSDAAESEISGVVSDITATTATLTLTCKPAEGKTVDKIVVSGLGVGKDITFTSTDNLTANLTNLTPGTTYNLTFTLTYTDNSTAVATKGFKTAEGTKPSITYTAFNGVTNITSNSADIKFTVTLANPDNYPIEYWRLASARAANDTKLDGVEYEKWPYNTDLIWGEYRSTENADGSYVITIPLKNLPAGTNINNWMKSEIKLSGSDAYESGGFDNQVFTTLAAGSITAEITNVTANSAVLTLTSVPEGTTSVVVSGLGEGKDVNVDLESKTANLEGLTANTTYNLTVTAYVNDKNSQSTVSFTTLSDSSSDKEVKMEFIEVNVSDLSALFRLKVQLIDNATSKESIHMYLRKADETAEATADDPYAKYGEAKGTPAVDMREGIENPIYFNYTELEKNTKYVATAVVKKDGYTGIATTEFETLGEANGTTSYIENGYFRDGKATTSDDGQELKMTYLATARYTFTYDKDNETLYLTFDTRIRNNPDLPDMQAKYILNVGDQTYYGAPLTNAAGFKDHYSFIINYRCPDIAKHIANGDKMTFTYYTDYAEGGQSFFGGVQYDGTTSSVDFGEPADVQWIAYSYAEQQEQNKNRYDLYKLKPKTQLMATVVDKEGHYLPRRIVQFEMAAEHADKAEVTYDLFAEQPKWFVEAKALDAGNEVDFEVVAFHVLENAETPAGAPRRAVSADGKRLEAKRGFHYIERDTPTGIDDIEADDANAPVRYFDLNGREISEPQKGMFVIRLQGSKATKMIAE